MKQRKRNNPTMLPPFGWRAAPNGKQRLVVYEPEATIIRQIFQLASQGASPEKVAELFNTAGVPHPGERLDDSYMERFFEYMRWKNPKIDPIVDPGLFHEVQERIEETGRRGKIQVMDDHVFNDADCPLCANPAEAALPLIRGVLDEMECPEHGRAAHPTEIIPECHPEAGTRAFYCPKHGTLSLFCNQCSGLQATIQVA
jgi:hypothetical protein